MARSSVSNLGDLLQKNPSMTMVGIPRPKSPKLMDKKFTYVGGKNEDWSAVSNAVTALFQRKKLAKLELSSLTEKVKTVKQEIGGPAICEGFKESLVKGMIILREDVKAKNGEVLLDKLADSWSYFFCTILPLLQAIFLDIQSREAQSTRAIALLNFRDVVVLKTKLEEAFVMDLTVPPKVVQMLLTLQVRLRMCFFKMSTVYLKSLNLIGPSTRLLFKQCPGCHNLKRAKEGVRWGGGGGGGLSTIVRRGKGCLQPDGGAPIHMYVSSHNLVCTIG